MFSAADANKNGLIERDEFVDLMTTKFCGDYKPPADKLSAYLSELDNEEEEGTRAASK